jgi:hypothetical protein
MYTQYSSIVFINKEIPTKVTLGSNSNFLYEITTYVVPFTSTYEMKSKLPRRDDTGLYIMVMCGYTYRHTHVDPHSTNLLTPPR